MKDEIEKFQRTRKHGQKLWRESNAGNQSQIIVYKHPTHSQTVHTHRSDTIQHAKDFEN